MGGASSRDIGLVLDLSALIETRTRDGGDDNVILVHCESTGAANCLPPVWPFELGYRSLNRVKIPSCR